MTHLAGAGIVQSCPVPVTTSLLDLLSVDNTVKENRLGQFVAQPRAFTPENIAPYMRRFKVGDTLRQYFGRPAAGK